MRGSGGCDRMVVEFTTTHVISGYDHKSCEFESRSWQGVLNTTLQHYVIKFVSDLRQFSDHHDITEILLKVTLNTITLTLSKT